MRERPKNLNVTSERLSRERNGDENSRLAPGSGQILTPDRRIIRCQRFGGLMFLVFLTAAIPQYPLISLLRYKSILIEC